MKSVAITLLYFLTAHALVICAGHRCTFGYPLGSLLKALEIFSQISKVTWGAHLFCALLVARCDHYIESMQFNSISIYTSVHMNTHRWSDNLTIIIRNASIHVDFFASNRRLVPELCNEFLHKSCVIHAIVQAICVI